MDRALFGENTEVDRALFGENTEMDRAFVISVLHLDKLGKGAVDEVLEGPGVRHAQGAELRSGFNVQGSGFRVQGSGFRVQGAGFRVQGSGCRVTASH